jgi:hypothetical protein
LFHKSFWALGILGNLRKSGWLSTLPTLVQGRAVTEEITPWIEHATYEVNVRGRQPKVSCETRGRRQPRETRTATVECRACSVTLRAPYRPDRKLPDVTVNAVRVRMVAQLGGYVNRPRSDEPGAETIWKGLQRMHDMAVCWDLFGPERR